MSGNNTDDLDDLFIDDDELDDEPDEAEADEPAGSGADVDPVGQGSVETVDADTADEEDEPGEGAEPAPVDDIDAEGDETEASDFADDEAERDDADEQDEELEEAEVDPLVAQVAELEEALATARAQGNELHERLLRKAADFDNARRRHQKERKELEKFAGEAVVKEVVPVLDDLERALGHVIESGDAPAALVEGVQMVHRKFEQVLSRRGVAPIDALGEPFDPRFHEAIQQVPDDTVPHNTIVQEFQKGFMLHERLIRPSLVVVSQGGPTPEPEEPAEVVDESVTGEVAEVVDESDEGEVDAAAKMPSDDEASTEDGDESAGESQPESDATETEQAEAAAESDDEALVSGVDGDEDAAEPSDERGGDA